MKAESNDFAPFIRLGFSGTGRRSYANTMKDIQTGVAMKADNRGRIGTAALAAESLQKDCVAHFIPFYLFVSNCNKLSKSQKSKRKENMNRLG